jgi:probable rRNA maturation factor
MPLSIDIDILEDAALPADARLNQLPQLIRYVLEAECATGEWTVSVLLTNDNVLRQLHRDFMGIDTETDVMTFPFGENLGKPEKGGEIAISVDRAIAQAPEFGFSTWDEIRFLVVHGTLHLIGWEDITDDLRDAMLVRQALLLSAFERDSAVQE